MYDVEENFVLDGKYGNSKNLLNAKVTPMNDEFLNLIRYSGINGLTNSKLLENTCAPSTSTETFFAKIKAYKHFLS